MTLTIGVDFDGCMFPLHTTLAAWTLDTGRTELPDNPDQWHYWRPLGVTDDEFEDLLDAFGEAGGFRMAAPYPEALEALTAIFDAGHDLIGVSSRPPTRAVSGATYGWVADWFLPLRSILLGPNAKLEAECDLIVDDNPVELVRVRELGEAVPVLLDRPYNRKAHGFLRVTWDELPGFLDTAAESVSGEPEGERRYALADLVEEMLEPDPESDDEHV